MITGDNPLTACHVANTLKMNEKTLLVLTKEQDDDGQQGKIFTYPAPEKLPHWETAPEKKVVKQLFQHFFSLGSRSEVSSFPRIRKIVSEKIASSFT